MSLADIWTPVSLTLSLATINTLVLLVLGTPIAWWLARSRSRYRELVGALVAMPLVLPPTVLGFYLLIALGPNGPGGWIAALWGGRTLAFSFTGLVIGSFFYSLPFMVQPLRNGFAAIGEEPLEAAATLGASGWQRFWRIALPLARPGYITGAVMTFAHTVGEFGVVLMIGGNIPGQTKVIAIALYDHVERLQWQEAHVIALGMVIFAFVVIAVTLSIDRRVNVPMP
ncbi:MAG: molybdate ABC transporter permease subunit [Alphaproteobacteria bacterium]|jgi:molybdate transport system permease protein|nr:molybdate ABC transporter permease subunit [Alphaproteobacteria bacterium]MBU1560462.1 molybdate ABC transporter permease subunit [Alphaproteobacteria bacterium]MBU2303787.1 molybdate ABC transporter permease subunit [Alphaproteobacteria bacterium]MBU2366386.1 molybdate ABC transporter permease subunit [Alphaproteobacteria bacterium]